MRIRNTQTQHIAMLVSVDMPRATDSAEDEQTPKQRTRNYCIRWLS